MPRGCFFTLCEEHIFFYLKIRQHTAYPQRLDETKCIFLQKGTNILYKNYLMETVFVEDIFIILAIGGFQIKKQNILTNFN